MKLLIQRVKEASVKVEAEVVGSIDQGLLVFIGIEKGDTQKDIDYLTKKVLNLRIFENDRGRIDQSIIDVEGELLLISQFTLCGNVKKGNRPSFTASAAPNEAIELYTKFIAKVKAECSLKVETGVFGAAMEVALINDGPFTLSLDS
ncbi:MAG: D-aminoacyl-tRNA deacylase [Flavobacteriales bacterium]|jgi:D-tyrosyl-tRNA(Tyr) deacylase|nr:D-aminoacyl-tRNA deacylase [Flavobacteriales bacterium]